MFIFIIAIFYGFIGSCLLDHYLLIVIYIFTVLYTVCGINNFLLIMYVINYFIGDICFAVYFVV